jgi:hypothetical protein
MTRALLVGLVALLATTGEVSAQPDRLYGAAEYLLWWTRDSPAPTPLVSDDTLDTPGVHVFIGGEDIDTGEHHGGRFTIGYWLTGDHAWGLEARYFFLPETTVSNRVSSSGALGSQVLFVPFFDVFPGSDGSPSGESLFAIAIPEAFQASVTESLESSLDGGELNLVRGLLSRPGWRLELLGGVRYLNLSETYTFDVYTPQVPPLPVDVFQLRDVFDADNEFYGGQAGVRGEYRRGRWFANGAVKVALGAMRESVDIDGHFITNDFTNFGPTQQFPGGLFAQPTNMGSHHQDVFAVVPELTLNVGYRLTSWASVFLGYTFLYASNVVRPAEQLDRNINPTQSPAFTADPSATLVGQASPSFRFRETDFWAQGVNFGVAFRY